jgi:hypothetical protein
MQCRLFQTGSIASPASRELHFVAMCEHLPQNFFRGCTSRIHAQVPVITTGKLESLHQHIPCAASWIERALRPRDSRPGEFRIAATIDLKLPFPRRLARMPWLSDDSDVV